MGPLNGTRGGLSSTDRRASCLPALAAARAGLPDGATLHSEGSTCHGYDVRDPDAGRGGRGVRAPALVEVGGFAELTCSFPVGAFTEGGDGWYLPA
ncbi:lasso RiPP family leader peptide-containing protein [Streptomyces nigrescens]